MAKKKNEKKCTVTRKTVKTSFKKMHFPPKGTFFSLFWNLKKLYLEKNSEQKCEKSVPGKKNSEKNNENKCEKNVPGKNS